MSTPMSPIERVQSALNNEHWLRHKRDIRDLPTIIQLHEMRRWLIPTFNDEDSDIPNALDRKFQVMTYLTQLIRTDKVRITDPTACLSWQLKTAEVLHGS